MPGINRSTLSAIPLVSDQITPQELTVLLRELTKVLQAGVGGDVVELGCYLGTSALFLQRQLQQTADKQLHVYDSFAGLPAKRPQDASPVGEQFTSGQLAATKGQLIRNFKQAGLPLPVIHKGWFEDLTPSDMPRAVCFGFLDGDFYSSILASLRLVWPLLQPGGVLVIDDYHTESLPGVRQALKEWSYNHSFNLHVEASLAIVKPIR